MTDIQKAIKFAEGEIKSLELAPKINGCEMTEWWKEQIEVWKTAISALEKQIPKKPTNYAIDNNGYMIYECECPTCKCSHKECYPFAYCNHCGQALDWGDSE